MRLSFVDPFRRNRALKWFYLAVGVALTLAGLITLISLGLRPYRVVIIVIGILFLLDAALGFAVARRVRPGRS
jgi:uncharacterized membrane protein HdeD (DUF308 family)